MAAARGSSRGHGTGGSVPAARRPNQIAANPPDATSLKQRLLHHALAIDDEGLDRDLA